MTEDQLQRIVDGAAALARVITPLEPLLVGIGEVVFAAFSSHVQATLPEIEAEWVLNEAQSAALMKPTNG